MQLFRKELAVEYTETLSQKVYKDIKSNIISGKWEMGKRITEKELSDSMHVSRSPIRWALDRLFDEGLLNYNKNVGYSVRIVTVDDVKEIYKIRTALEVLSFKEAALKMTEDDFKVLYSLIAKSERAIENNDIQLLLSSSNEFNLKIYEFAGMPRLKFIQQNLQEYLEALRSISFAGTFNERRDRAVKEHKLIVRLMKLKYFSELEAQIEEHLSHSKNYILSVAADFETFIYSENRPK